MDPFPAAVAVDLVILTVRRSALHALVVERGVPPFRGWDALPGGFVRPDEDLLTAARRELAEETGVGEGDLYLEQLGTYGAPDRDPRQRVISVAHLAMAADLPEPVAGSDAAAARWSPMAELVDGRLAFDHADILADGVERARAKLEYTTLATEFCPDPFTIAELRSVYEAVWGTELDPGNFHRKVLASEGFVEEAGESTTRGGGRPARLYRAGPGRAVHPPLAR